MPAQTPETATVHEEPEPMLQPGVPMPVSADPDVPDPASLHASPMDSPKPAPAEDENDSDGSDVAGTNTAIASAIPPSLFKNMSGHRTVSGLFTPMSESSSYPPSPNMEDATDAQAEPEADTTAAAPNAPSPPNVDDTEMVDVSTPPHNDEIVALADEEDASDVYLAEDRDTSTPTEDVTPASSGHAKEQSPLSSYISADLDDDDDADADGDIDPDYVPTTEPELDVDVSHAPCSPEESVEPVARALSVIPEIQVNGEASAIGTSDVVEQRASLQ